MEHIWINLYIVIGVFFYGIPITSSAKTLIKNIFMLSMNNTVIYL